MKIRRNKPVQRKLAHLSLVEPLEERRAPAAFVVDTNLDGTVSGKTTLRDAINMSNATPGPNTITFAIGSGGVQTINLTSPLPALTQPVSILGGSQTGTSYTSIGIILNGSGAGSGSGFNVEGGSSVIEGFAIQNFAGNGILLQSSGGDEVINDLIGVNGTGIAAAHNTLDGVLINNIGGNAIQDCVISGNTGNGIEITGAAGTLNLIGAGYTANFNVDVTTAGGNFIGISHAGSAAIPNGADGILIHNSASDNTLMGNTVSGNTGNGVHITGIGMSVSGAGTTGNILLGNLIGTDSTGGIALGNKGDGILIDNGANNTQMGDGTQPNANVISANLGNGIHIAGTGQHTTTGLGTTGNTVQGNYIGTNITGTLALGNAGDGVLIANSASGNTIGSDFSVNVISGNANGIEISGIGPSKLGGGTTGNTVIGNYIGVNASGAAALGNTGDGVLLDNGANGNQIGDGFPGGTNVISGNGGNGIHMSGSGAVTVGTGTTGNTVTGNYIGVDVTGAKALGNHGDGILLDTGANGNSIGVDFGGNVISANGANGIELDGVTATKNGLGTTGNMILGNIIGADVSGSIALGNADAGILLSSSANDNQIGDGSLFGGNQISANGGAGIYIHGAGSFAAGLGTAGNQVLGNLIGVNSIGTKAMGNGGDGVLIDNGANDNVIGSDTSVNVISANANGVEISGMGASKAGTGTFGNHVLGNSIGTDGSGSLSLGNLGDGILIDNGANETGIGDGNSGGGNVISGNGANGVHLIGVAGASAGTGTTANVLLGNSIGTDSNGGSALGNAGDGVLIAAGANGNVIGSSSTVNVISGNGAAGVRITGTGSTGNLLYGNYIGLDSTGNLALGNTGDGVQIDGGASSNQVGGVAQGDGNVISANGGNGLHISGTGSGGAGTTGTLVYGNFIGTDASGSVSAGNTGDGVLIDNGAAGTFVGNGSAGAANVISGNGGAGVHISGFGAGAAGAGTTGNQVLGDFIGTDYSGSMSLGNSGDGILIDNGANANKIGNGTAAGANVISGNGGNGIEISGSNLVPGSGQVGTTNITIAWNYIGTDLSGSFALGNNGDGILIDNGASNLTVGAAKSHNIISGNGGNGIEIAGTGAGAAGTGTAGITVINNDIGTDVSGAQALGNTGDGVLIDNGANTNLIGNGTAGGANVISGNGGNGIEINGSNLVPGAGSVGTSNNTVAENFIGTDFTGSVSLGNSGDGVLIDNGASGNTIGAITSHNIISDNNNGVHISGVGAGAAGAGTTGNLVIGNYIGTDISGTLAFGNAGDGVLVDNGANANQIGNGAVAGANIISGNGTNGIEISGSNLTLSAGQTGTASNMVLRNYVGTDVTGKVAIGNGNDGVLIDNGASGNTIGATTSHNLISGNMSNGVEITGSGTAGNLVIGNYIGTDTTGANALADGADGVLIGAGANSNTVGGAAAGYRNVISGNEGNGVHLDGTGTAANNVLGNYIGTDLTGNKALANVLDGVLVSGGATGNDVGNGMTGGGNVISGNWGNGVEIAQANANFVMGNLIGPGVSGAALGNQLSGVSITSGSNNVIGGEAAGAGNTIEYSGADGVGIYSGTGNAIQQNSIYASGQLGIDLGGIGVTTNTPGGAGSGPNLDENYPVIISAQYNGGQNGTSVMFTFNGVPNSTYNLEFFDSPVANGSGYGEGLTPITPVPITITTDGAGNYSSTISGLAGALPGTVIAATATDANGNTSEFSAAATVVPVAPNVENISYVVGAHNKLTGLEVQFSAALAKTSITTGSIELFTANVHGQYVKAVSLSKTEPFVYNATTDTVTINPLRPLAPNHFYEVYVNGTTDPVTSSGGTPLDGEFTSVLPSGDGVPGGDFSALVAYGTKIAYKDSATNKVTLTLARGGDMEVIRPMDATDAYLELAKVISGKTILAGKVIEGKTGTGVTTIEGIIGLDGAINNLPATEFDIINSMVTLLQGTEEENMVQVVAPAVV